MTIVMPTYGAPDVTFDAVKSLRRTVDAKRVRIVVVDDASAPEHQERLQGAEGRRPGAGARERRLLRHREPRASSGPGTGTTWWC